MIAGNYEWIFWTLCVGLVVYEFFALCFTKKPDDHITAIIRDRLSSHMKLVPFMFGMLMGHFFWCK